MMFEEDDKVLVIDTNKTGIVKYVAPIGDTKIYYVIEDDDKNEHHFYREHEIKPLD